MAEHRVALIPGDGIGPEITRATTRVVDAAGMDMLYEVCDDQTGDHGGGTVLPRYVVETCRRCGTVLKGPFATPPDEGAVNASLVLRRELGLYATVVPAGVGAWLPTAVAAGLEADCVEWRDGGVPAARGALQTGAGVRHVAQDAGTSDAHAAAELTAQAGAYLPAERGGFLVVYGCAEDLCEGIEFPKGSRGAQRISRLAMEEKAGIIRGGAAMDLRPISVKESERLVRFAFERALSLGYGRVTALHGADSLPQTDGLFARAARRVAGKYAGNVAFGELLVSAGFAQIAEQAASQMAHDALCLGGPDDEVGLGGASMQRDLHGLHGLQGPQDASGRRDPWDLLIQQCPTGQRALHDLRCPVSSRNPCALGVVVMPGLYGPAAAGLAAGLGGGQGVVVQASFGQDCAVFETVGGAAPALAGKNEANPAAQILSAAMMLEHLGEHGAAQRIAAAVCRVLGRRGALLSTTAFANAAIAALQ